MKKLRECILLSVLACTGIWAADTSSEKSLVSLNTISKFSISMPYCTDFLLTDIGRDLDPSVEAKFRIARLKIDRRHSRTRLAISSRR